MDADEPDRPSDRRGAFVTHAVDEKSLRSILRSLRAALARVSASIDGIPDGWHPAPYDPNALLNGFRHIGLRPGYRLASYQFVAGANGNGLTLVIPVGRHLPPPLGDCTRLSSMTEPGAVPRWARRDVARYVQGDGTPLSYFEASLFLREVQELGALWHGCSWSTHEIVTSVRDLAGSGWTWTVPRPGSLAPIVTEWTDGRRRVEFYTHTALGQSRVCRHRDNYRKTYRPRCTVSTVAQGEGGYVF